MYHSHELKAVARLLYRGFDPPDALRGPLFGLSCTLGPGDSAEIDRQLDRQLADGGSPVETVDRFYQQGRADRRRDGVFYTPTGLARWLVDHALEPLTAGAPLRVGDPCCGCGAFLVAAVDSLIARGLSVEGLCGTDLDPHAVEIARILVYRRALAQGAATGDLARRLAEQIRVGDGLTDLDDLDAVVSNPPFGSAIASDTARTSEETARHRNLFGPIARGAYDLSFVFAAAALRALRPGGRYGLVLPRSVLSVSSGAGLRAAFEAEGPPEAIWAPDDAKLFEDADIFVALLVGERASSRAMVSVSTAPPENGSDPPMRRVQRGAAETWSGLLLSEHELVCQLRDSGIELGRLDEFAVIHGGAATGAAYDLRPHVTLDGDGLKLVTTGLIDRYQCLWAESRCRYLKGIYERPRWPGADLPDVPVSVARAADRQRVPKVLVGGLSRVIEAVADPLGELGGVVSTWVVRPLEQGEAALWLTEALLNSAALSLVYMTDFRGKELSGGNTTVGQRELRSLPVPADLGLLVARAESRLPDASCDVFALDPHADGDRILLVSWIVALVAREGTSVALPNWADCFASAAISALYGLSRAQNDSLNTWFDRRTKRT